MAGRLDGKVAIVTGGGSGIGRACSQLFAREGAAVCVADLNLDGASETVTRIETAGGKALALRVDTTNESATEQMVARCVDEFGSVDVLVAAAGIADPPAGPYPTLNISADDFRRFIDVNLFGVLFSDRAVARWMIENGRGGSIINLASIAAHLPSASAYSVSKAGTWMLTKVLALELAKAGIRVNAIAPGYIETPMTTAMRENENINQRAMQMTPMGRWGQPEEIANTALFLATDESSYFTGEILHPAGGVFVG